MWREKLGTGLIVIALTGLIWFFADQADRDIKTRKLVLKVQTPAHLVLMGHEPAPLEFDVTFRAPRGVIREIENEFQNRPWQATYMLEDNVAPGRRTFEAARIFPQLDVIRQRGLTVESVEPAGFTLDIDTLETRRMYIKPWSGELVIEHDEPRPNTCQVILPGRMAQRLAGEELSVDIRSYIDPNQPDWVTRTVELRWPEDGPQARLVRFDPDTFQLRLRLTDVTSQRSFDSMQVHYIVQPIVLRRYQLEEVQPDEWRPTIHVSGPARRIESLRKEDIRVFVDVLPEDEKRVGQPITRRVSVFLPPGLQAVEPLPEVRFILRDPSVPAG